MGYYCAIKNHESYKNDWNAPCYHPENAEKGEDYTHNDLLKLVKGDMEICDKLFDALDWCFPETLIDEWLMNGLIEECDHCRDYFIQEKRAVSECPKCGGVLDHEEDSDTDAD